MAKGPATPQLTAVQQDAVKGLTGLGIAKARATDLVLHAQGSNLQDIMNSALKMHGTAPRPSNVPPPLPSPLPAQPQRMPPPQGARIQAAQGMPVPPVGQTPPSLPRQTPPPLPQAQQQIPGFAPPGGPQAAPNAQQLAQMAQQGPTPGGAPQPNWFWRMMGATPPPAPVSKAPQAPPAQPKVAASTPPTGQVKPQAPPVSMPPPAPVKPRIRVRAAGGRTPEEAPAAQPSTPAELPMVSSQEEYDKLPIGSRFRHPDGYIYRKESHSGAEQKLQEGGTVQPKGPWEASWEPTYEATEGQDTDTVPAKLTPGEYVVPKPAVDQIGKENLDAMSTAAQGKEPPGSSTPGTSSEGSTSVGPTGEKADPSGQPSVRGLAYGPKSEGASKADMTQVTGAWDQPLQPGDIAVSPNLQKLYPLHSYVDVVDSDGNVVLHHAHVADTSMYSKGNPTENTFEIWNGRSLGKGYHLVPVG